MAPARAGALHPTSPIDNHRNLRMWAPPLRLAADQQTAEPAPPVRRHEDHIATAALGCLDDPEIRRRMHACFACKGNTRAARGPLNLFQMQTRLPFAALLKID